MKLFTFVFFFESQIWDTTKNVIAIGLSLEPQWNYLPIFLYILKKKKFYEYFLKTMSIKT